MLKSSVTAAMPNLAPLPHAIEESTRRAPVAMHSLTTSAPDAGASPRNSSIEATLRQNWRSMQSPAALTLKHAAAVKRSDASSAILTDIVASSSLPKNQKIALTSHLHAGTIAMPKKLDAAFLEQKLAASSGTSGTLSETSRALLDDGERLPPTQAWLTKYGEGGHAPGWDDGCLDKLPCNPAQLIEEEKKRLDTHIPLYHAHRDDITPCQSFIDALVQVSDKNTPEKTWPNQVQWCRNPFEPSPNKKTCGDADEMREMMHNLAGKDNSDIGKWHMLSCNPSFFQNSNRAAEESTADYLHDNISVSAPNGRDYFNKILDDAELLVKPESAPVRERLLVELNRAYAEAGSEKKGVLWQIFVPHHLVDHVAYVAGDNGVPDVQNPHALETLLKLQLQHQDGAALPENHVQLQMRLSTSLLHDPAISPQLQIKKYGPLPDEAMRNFNQAVAAIAKDAIAHSLQEKLPPKTS